MCGTTCTAIAGFLIVCTAAACALAVYAAAWGSGFRLQGLGYRVQVSGFRFQVSGFRVLAVYAAACSGFGVSEHIPIS